MNAVPENENRTDLPPGLESGGFFLWVRGQKRPEGSSGDILREFVLFAPSGL